MHPVYSKDYLESVAPSHKPPKQVGARPTAPPRLRWASLAGRRSHLEAAMVAAS